MNSLSKESKIGLILSKPSERKKMKPDSSVSKKMKKSVDALMKKKLFIKHKSKEKSSIRLTNRSMKVEIESRLSNLNYCSLMLCKNVKDKSSLSNR